MWFKQGLYRFRSTTAITRERNDVEQYDFDLRLLNFISEGFECLEGKPKEWLKFATVSCVRPLVFIRENVFEKVRNMDRESARLETAVVSLEWTREMLREFKASGHSFFRNRMATNPQVLG